MLSEGCPVWKMTVTRIKRKRNGKRAFESPLILAGLLCLANCTNDRICLKFAPKTLFDSLCSKSMLHTTFSNSHAFSWKTEQHFFMIEIDTHDITHLSLYALLLVPPRLWSHPCSCTAGFSSEFEVMKGYTNVHTQNLHVL